LGTATVGGHAARDDGQTEPSAATFPGSRAIHAVEGSENVGELALRYARALILDDDGMRLTLHPHRATFGRIFERIFQHITERTEKQLFVDIELTVRIHFDTYVAHLSA